MQWRWLKARRKTNDLPLGEVNRSDAEPETVQILDLTSPTLGSTAPEQRSDVTPSDGVLVAAAATKATPRRTRAEPKTGTPKAPAKPASATKGASTTARKSASTRSADSPRKSPAKPPVKKTVPRSK
jgi:hypothetical protein